LRARNGTVCGRQPSTRQSTPASAKSAHVYANNNSNGSRPVNGDSKNSHNESDNDDTTSSTASNASMKVTGKSNHENLSVSAVNNNNAAPLQSASVKSFAGGDLKQPRMTRKSLQLLNNKTSSNCGLGPTAAESSCGGEAMPALAPPPPPPPPPQPTIVSKLSAKISELKAAAKANAVSNEDENALDGFTKDENVSDEMPPPVPRHVKSSIKIEKLPKGSSSYEGSASNLAFGESVDNNEDEDVDMTNGDSVFDARNATGDNTEYLSVDDNSNTNLGGEDEQSQQVNNDSNMDVSMLPGATLGGAKRGRKRKVRRTNLEINGQFNV
jgi:hypothetical protein